MEERKNATEDLGKELKRIYSDAKGELPDFTRLDGRPSSRLRSILSAALAGALVTAAIVWGGVFYFSRTQGFTGDAVSLSITTSGGLVSGSVTDVTVHYRNGARVPLARADLELTVPNGFKVLGAEPEAGKDGVWSIGAVAPGSEGSVTVHGEVRKELGAALTFEAKLGYRPGDFNSDFQKVASHTAAVDGSVLAVSATGTDEVTPGDAMTAVFRYENLSDRDLENVRMIMDAPDGFIPASSTPNADQDVAMRWTFAKIPAHAKGTVTVKGTFSATSRGPKSLTARMGFIDDQDALIPMAQAETKAEVRKSDLGLALIVNGSDTPSPAAFGDTLFFSVRYENTGDLPLKDVTIAAKLPSEPAGPSILDWVSLKDDLKGRRTDSTLTWTKKELPALAALKPGDKGEIDFSIPLVRKPYADAKTFENVIHAKASAIIAKTGTAQGPRAIDTAPFDIRLLSDVSLEAAGRYYTDDGAPLGSGPIPPQVRQKTVYRIFWTIRNSLHELTNLSLSTVLPQGVKWTGTNRQVDAGTLTFDDTGRQATWRLNRLPTSAKSVLVSFDVELTPESEDIGKILDLTGDSRLEAFDKDVSAVILKTTPPVGTDLVGDDMAAGKGIVKE